jgi:hypothetical protein
VKVRAQIGFLCDFVWKCMEDFKFELKEGCLALNEERFRMYARVLQLLLFMKVCKSECVTPIATCLYPAFHDCSSHQDSLNDWMRRYKDTGAFNCVVKDSKGHLWLLQLVLNFRHAAGLTLMPYKSDIASILSNMVAYVERLRDDYNLLLRKRIGRHPTKWSIEPFCREGFYLDDEFKYEKINIADEDRDPILLSVIPLTIGPSRIFSFGMVIGPLVKLGKNLAFDQMLELAFIATLQNSPARFFHVVTSVQEELMDDDVTHPFYVYQKYVMTTFGSMQGGPFPRFSPFGMSLSDIFGEDEAEMEGRDCLSRRVVTVFSDVIHWIDSLVGRSISDLPISEVETSFGQFCESLKIATEGAVARSKLHSSLVGGGSKSKFYFSLFRLQCFTSVVIGCGMTKDGPHLRQIAFPTKNTASYNHLANPTSADLPSHSANSLAGCDNVSEDSCDNNGKTKLAYLMRTSTLPCVRSLLR